MSTGGRWGESEGGGVSTGVNQGGGGVSTGVNQGERWGE